MDETVVLWKGKRPEEMTREELVSALTQSIRLNLRAHEAHRHTLDLWDAFRKARSR